MPKYCPTCRREYPVIENFCRKCGIPLEKIPNKCSENKTSFCKDAKLNDDDLFCPFCGSKTTYALGMMDGDW